MHRPLDFTDPIVGQRGLWFVVSSMIEFMANELAALLTDIPGQSSSPEDDINYWVEEAKMVFPEWDPWFSQLPAGRDAEFFQLGIFVRAELFGDELHLGTIVDEDLLYSGGQILWGEGSVVDFDSRNPLSFLPIRVLRWMRFSLSVFDMRTEEQFWRTRPGEYFGVRLPVENDPIYGANIELLCRMYQPAYSRGEAPDSHGAPTARAVFLIYQRWVAAGCPPAWTTTN
jgi:hypothetical protein